MTDAKVGMYGAVGSNLGDEAIAIAIAKRLRAHAEFTIFAQNAERLRRLYPGYSFTQVVRSSVRGQKELYHNISSLDLFLLGGGTLVQDKARFSPLRGVLPSATQAATMARFAGVPAATVPIGVDELSTRLGRLYARAFFSLCREVCVRDSTSADFSERYGCRERPLIFADPAYLIDGSPSERAPRPYLAISAVRENLNVPDTCRALRSVIMHYVNVNGGDVVLIPMDRNPAEELSIFNLLLGGLPTEIRDSVKIISPETPVSELVSVLRGAEVLLAARLHAAILAVGHVPIVGLSRATKTQTLFAEYGIASRDLRVQLDSRALIQLMNDASDEDLSFQRELRARATNSAEAGVDHLAAMVLEGFA